MGVNGVITGVRYGWVVSNIDPAGAGRVAVRLAPDDNDKKNNEIEVSAFPLNPKMFYVRPKIGEGVFVLFANNNDGKSQRYYIGPIISQPHRMYFEPFFMGGDRYQKGAIDGFDVNPLLDDEAYGAYQGPDDVAIMGRKNCDILISNDDVRIRAGVKIVDDNDNYNVVFNEKDPAYIKLKYHNPPLVGDNHSTATIVADKINLLSNKSTDPDIETTDRDDLITDEELNKVLQDAYSLPYGEKLVALLKKMINVFNSHTHDYICLPPDVAFIDEMNALKTQYLEGVKPPLLSDTVRIN